MGRKPEESDWKAYSRSIPEWRDRYFKKVNSELVELLQRDEHTPTENFRDAYEEMKNRAKILDDCLGHYSRSKMAMSVFLMYRRGLLEEGDLDIFSDELRDRAIAMKECL